MFTVSVAMAAYLRHVLLVQKERGDVGWDVGYTLIPSILGQYRRHLFGIISFTALFMQMSAGEFQLAAVVETSILAA